MATRFFYMVTPLEDRIITTLRTRTEAIGVKTMVYMFDGAVVRCPNAEVVEQVKGEILESLTQQFGVSFKANEFV